MADELSPIITFSEDISEAEQPDPLPISEYPGVVTAAQVMESQLGNLYAAVTFMISPDAFPADYPVENAPEGKLLVFRRVGLSDNPATRARLRAFCEALGAPMAQEITVTDWIGLNATLRVDHSEYEGVVREEIKSVVAA